MLYLIAIFGGLLPAFFGAVKYWRRSHVNANCWFCGLNNIILKKCQDGWICRHCDQYNGFKPDGDYNRDIPAQWDSSLNQRLSYCSTPKTAPKFSNGLCQECNRNQEVKIAQLASFCPINPENFEYEIDNFSYHLERAYRLCPPCEMVLEEILSRKKTHVLDMNLQLTGKNNQRSKFIASKQGFSTLVQTNLFLTTLLIVLVVLSILYTIPSDHSKIIGVGNKEEVISELSFSYPPSYLSLLLPTPPVCPQLEFDYFSNRKPDLRLQKILEAYFEGVRLFILPLSVSGLVIQGISSWFTGGRLTLLLWLALIGTVSFGDIANEKLEHLQQCPILEITLAVFILIFSWREAIVQKRKSLQIKKHLTGNITSKLPKRTVGSIAGNGLLSSNTIKFPAQMTTSNQTLSAPVGIPGQEFSTLDTTNYLNLPSRPSSVSSHRTLTSASGLFDNCTVSPAVDTPSAQYQEDARSDASIDSAFSNADSITLDAVDAFNGSSPLLLGRNKDSEGDVHSLIEGLSLGPCKSKNLKKPAEFKTKSYLLDKKRQSLLSPAKLTNIMNESVASGIWRNTNNICKWTEGSKQKQCPSYGFDSPCSQAAILSPGSTKTGSLICSSRPITPMNMLSVATVPSKSSTGISNSGFSVSATPTPNGTLSQTVMPPSTIVSNAGFGTAVSSGPISPTPHIVYTPFGLYHQVVGPYGNPVYMMPSQSPIFSNSSPSCSLGSQFSPQSCSRSSHNDLNSFYESDSLSSPKSTHFKTRINSKLSTSFLESVWQSRYAILYTTLCYLMAGTVVYMFSYNGLILSVPSTLTKWKEQLLLFLTEV